MPSNPVNAMGLTVTRKCNFKLILVTKEQICTKK
nr:MAG TPA: hypothetical protein [Caudoviricetes sp.]